MYGNEELHRDWYTGDRAEFYARSSWMAREQLTTAERVMELLEDSVSGIEIDPSVSIIADLGCGNGYSSYLPENSGAVVIGIDLSFDMLTENLRQQFIIRSSEEELEKFRKEQLSKENPRKEPVPAGFIPFRHIINADIAHLPFRPRVFDAVISISAFNFVLDGISDANVKEKIMYDIARKLRKVIKPMGKIIIEFYPEKKDLPIYMAAFGKYFEGGLLIDNPGLRKEKRYLVLVPKSKIGPGRPASSIRTVEPVPIITGRGKYGRSDRMTVKHPKKQKRKNKRHKRRK